MLLMFSRVLCAVVLSCSFPRLDVFWPLEGQFSRFDSNPAALSGTPDVV